MELPFEVPEGLELVRDVTPGSWLAGRRMPTDGADGVRVGEIIPTGFEAYARIFHPATEGRTRRRWSELAERNGRSVHPQMQLEHIVGDLAIHAVPGLEPPLEALAEDEVDALASILGPFTMRSDLCWYALWEGYGTFGGGGTLYRTSGEDPVAIAAARRAEEKRARRAQAALDAIPKLRLLRDYFLFRGPLRLASTLVINGWHHSPNLWWPEDRTWCVATEIDGYSTYVAGSAACIAAVLADPRLESLPSDPRNRFDVWSDRVNPPPPGLRERWGR